MTDFSRLKARIIYQFFIDEETGEITDITKRTDYVPVIRCKDCRHRSTTHFCSDEQEWCDFWRPLFGESHSTDLNKYCAWAERNEE